MSWWSYEDAKEQKAELQRQLERRIQRGESLVRVEAPQGRKLAEKFWGQAWQRHLESYADYETRLPRGRSYLRQGQVYNLEIEEGVVRAEVAGSAMYEVCINFDKLSIARWEVIKQACAGQGMSLLDLLSGKVGEAVLRVITDRDEALFPLPKEIHLNCNCPDHAGLCKHAAAVLYAIGLRFDAEPELFFKLRGVDYRELLDQAAAGMTADALSTDAATISGDDLASVFGIDMDLGLAPESEAALSAPPKTKPAKKAAMSPTKKAATKKRKAAKATGRTPQ